MRASIGLPLVGILSIFGCSNAATTAATTASVQAELASPFADYTKLAGTQAFLSALSKYATVNLGAANGAYAASIANGELAIGSFKFSRLGDMAKSFQADYAAMHEQYGSLAGYWRSLGVTSATKINFASFSNGILVYQRINNAYLSGKKLPGLTRADLAAAAQAQIVSLALATGAHSSSLGLDDAPAVGGDALPTVPTQTTDSTQQTAAVDSNGCDHNAPMTMPEQCKDYLQQIVGPGYWSNSPTSSSSSAASSDSANSGDGTSVTGSSDPSTNLP